MFGNQPGSYGNNNQSINTHLDTFFGEYSYMNLGCWDDKLTFQVVPCTGTTEAGRKMYDKEAGVRTAVTHPKICALLKKYRLKLKEKIDNNEDPGENGIAVGVPIQSIDRGTNSPSTTGLFIEYAYDKNGVPATFLTIGKDMSGDNFSRIIQFKFDNTNVLVGNSPSKGGFVEERTEADFEWFITLLEAHALVSRYGDHGRRIAERVYAQRQNNRGGGGYNQQNNGGYPQNSGPIQAPMGPDMNIPDGMDGFSVFN